MTLSSFFFFFQELPFLSWQKFRVCFCLSRLKRGVGERWRASQLLTEERRKNSPGFPSSNRLFFSSSSSIFYEQDSPFGSYTKSSQCCYQLASLECPFIEWPSYLTTSSVLKFPAGGEGAVSVSHPRLPLSCPVLLLHGSFSDSRVAWGGYVPTYPLALTRHLPGEEFTNTEKEKDRGHSELFCQKGFSQDMTLEKLNSSGSSLGPYNPFILPRRFSPWRTEIRILIHNVDI